MKKEKIIEFFKRLEAIDPEPKGELDHKDPYTLLVAVVLSAQATDIGVNKATPHLFALADNPFDMAKLSVEDIQNAIKTIGLYKAKAKNVRKLSEMLVEKYDGVVPDNRDALVELPGVGRKTANVVLNMAFGHHTMAVDTHVFRVGNRTGMAKAKTVEETERIMMKKIPDQFMMHAHHWLILHGRYTCKARKPDCPNCVVSDLCSFKEKTL